MRTERTNISSLSDLTSGKSSVGHERGECGEQRHVGKANHLSPLRRTGQTITTPSVQQPCLAEHLLSRTSSTTTPYSLFLLMFSPTLAPVGLLSRSCTSRTTSSSRKPALLRRPLPRYSPGPQPQAQIVQRPARLSTSLPTKRVCL